MKDISNEDFVAILNKDNSGEWNQWKESEAGRNLDIKLIYNFNKDIVNYNFRKMEMHSCNFQSIEIVNCDFSNVYFTDVKFVNVSFKNCSFDYSKLEASCFTS